MKCFISLTVLLGVASAAATRILICSDQTMGGSCVVMDVDGCSKSEFRPRCLLNLKI